MFWRVSDMGCSPRTGTRTGALLTREFDHARVTLKSGWRPRRISMSVLARSGGLARLIATRSLELCMSTAIFQRTAAQRELRRRWSHLRRASRWFPATRWEARVTVQPLTTLFARRYAPGPVGLAAGDC